MVISFVRPKMGMFFGPYLDYLLMILIFLSCLDVDIGKFRATVKEYRKLAGELAVVHLASPLIVWVLRKCFSPEIFLGMILVTAVPTGRSAVFLSNIFGGEAEKALVISTLSNVLSPVIVPFLVLALAGKEININWVQMGGSMGKLVIVPIVIALVVRKVKIIEKINRYNLEISTFLVFLIVMGIIAPIKEQVSGNWALSIGLLLVGLVLMTINFLAGYRIGQSQKEKITFGISASYKNYSLATVVALTLFSPIVALPSLVYAVANNLLLIPIQWWLSRKAVK